MKYLARVCTKCFRAKVRQGENRRGSAVNELLMSIASLFSTQHHRAQIHFVQTLGRDDSVARGGDIESGMSTSGRLLPLVAGNNRPIADIQRGYLLTGWRSETAQLWHGHFHIPTGSTTVSYAGKSFFYAFTNPQKLKRIGEASLLAPTPN